MTESTSPADTGPEPEEPQHGDERPPVARPSRERALREDAGNGSEGRLPPERDSEEEARRSRRDLGP